MDINHNEDGGWTWLIAATWGMDFPLIQLLVFNGADP